ncbi:hypothetical protein ACPCBF_32570 [Streptomyces pseudogriseolus]|uniref:hypothetical protein n=1 Tax=Streptomyces pseudogriseolus TaxID=36817 RepID=UPI003FA26635
MNSDESSEIKLALTQLNPDEERREQVSQQIQAAQTPELIRSVESSEVIINIDPDELPYEDINYHELINGLKQRYKLRLDTTGLQKILNNTPHSSTIQNLSDDEKAKLSYSVTEKITFREGKFPGLGHDQYTPIYELTFHSQNLAAKVHGRTNIAELLIKEAFELAWDAAGMPRKWENEEVQREVATKSYGTHTKVDLGGNVLRLISPAPRHFLQDNLSANLRLGARMMARSALDGFEPPSDVAGTLSLDELVVRFAILDLKTGRMEAPKVKLTVMARNEMGGGVVDVVSELPFEDHVKLVEGLAIAINQDVP